MSDETSLNPIELATEITIAWLNNPNNRVSADDVPMFLRTIHSTMKELLTGTASGVNASETQQEFTPAVSVRRSTASKDHILSLIDGKPYKTLTRHLARHGLTAEQYRQRYGLRPDYPMVAENYAAHRRDLAKRIGLGRRPAKPEVIAQESVISAKAPARKPRAAKVSKTAASAEK
jgi:predicted transcriptional regulator